jgi:hypothetical protein
MKKILLIISAVFALAGCGGGSSDTSGNLKKGKTYIVSNYNIRDTRYSKVDFAKMAKEFNKVEVHTCAEATTFNGKSLLVQSEDCSNSDYYGMYAREFRKLHAQVIALWGFDYEYLNDKYVSGDTIRVVFINLKQKGVMGRVSNTNFFVSSSSKHKGLTIYVNRAFFAPSGEYQFHWRIFSTFVHEYTHILEFYKQLEAGVDNTYRDNYFMQEMLALLTEEAIGYTTVNPSYINNYYYKDVNKLDADAYNNLRFFARYILQKYDIVKIRELIEADHRTVYKLQALMKKNVNTLFTDAILCAIKNKFTYKEFIAGDYVFKLPAKRFDLKVFNSPRGAISIVRPNKDINAKGSTMEVQDD